MFTISHSGLWLFEHNRRKFYCQYMAKNRRPRDPATEPMKLGSSIDVRIKNELQRDLGLPVVSYPIEDDVYRMSERVMEVVRSSGEYDHLLRRLKESLDGGGQVLMEHEVNRCVGDFRVRGFIDLCMSDYPGGPFHILDFKCTGWYGKPVVSGVYNRYGKIDGTVGSHKKFVDEGGDSWCGYGGSNKKYVDQLYLYWRLLNKDNPNVHQSTLGVAKGGIMQILPTGVACSFGELESDVFKRMSRMAGMMKSRHLFEDMTWEENLRELEYLEDPIVQATL